MTGADDGATPAEAIDELDAAWSRLEADLGAYLATMSDPGDDDVLRIELVDPDPGGDDVGPPYAQFACFAGGAMIRAELSGDAHLLPPHRLDQDGCELLAGLGWVGNAADGGAGDRNWSFACPLDEVGGVADHVTWVLRHHFGIPHPHLLTYAAWGPAAGGADVLGLCASEEVPVDDLSAPSVPTEFPLVQVPTDLEDLTALVGAVLREKYEGETTLDDDGDFVLHHMGQAVWVRVRTDQPAVEIMARVVHDVRSRRATAVEIGLLNRDDLWSRWTLRDRAVWQTLVLPGVPFVPRHLDVMLDVFIEAMTSTRDDLALRTGAKLA